jgi:hypothetical protein
MNRHVTRAIIVLSLAALLTGCGGPSLVEVEGMVTLNGKPLDNVRVEFLPDPEKQTTGPRSTGVTDAQGRFKLICENQKSGAVIGTHRVLITDLKQWEGLTARREDADKQLKPSRIPARYTDVRNTPFRLVEVKTGGPPVNLAVTTR